MGTKAVKFFALDANEVVIRRFAIELESVQVREPVWLNFVPQLKMFFKILITNTGTFDQYCQENIAWIGEQFISQLNEFPRTAAEKQFGGLYSIFTMAYRFLCELEFSQPGNLSLELQGVRNFALENLQQFPEPEKQQLIYANYVMPVSITKKIVNSAEMGEFRAFSETAKTASDMKKEWDAEIAAKSQEITALRAGIDRIKTTYNFVGLVKGFETLTSVKKAERARTLIFLWALGVFMVLPLILEIIFILNHIESIDSHKNTLIYSLPSIVTLEVILLYLFRVVLSHFRGVSSQLLQLNLRTSLCQFIQSYAEYSTEIRKQNSGALDKFEGLIFSSIISDEAIPATFDGVEQIAKLISSIRNGKA